MSKTYSLERLTTIIHSIVCYCWLLKACHEYSLLCFQWSHVETHNMIMAKLMEAAPFIWIIIHSRSTRSQAGIKEVEEAVVMVVKWE